MIERNKYLVAAMLAGVLSGLTPQAASSEELVIVATGGGFGEALRTHFYEPFSEETGIEIIEVPAPIGDQNAKLRAMLRTGNVEYDVITTTDMAVVADADLYADLDCSRVPNAVENGVPGSCGAKSLLRTAGAVMIAYDERAFPEGGPRSWSEFWDVEAFPGARCLPGGGGRKPHSVHGRAGRRWCRCGRFVPAGLRARAG